MKRWYKIKKGRHDSRIMPTRLYARRITAFTAVWNIPIACRQTYEKGSYEEEQVSKVIGVSHWYHKRNSVRIGWSPNASGGLYDAHAYIRVNGKVVSKQFIGRFLYGEWVQCCVEFGKDCVLIDIAGEDDAFVQHIIETPGLPVYRAGYILEPYYGGEKPAPEDFVIVAGIMLFNNDKEFMAKTWRTFKL
ncbi:hypothetical protein [uncultured Sphaerochaeta sp.]|uniref:hypothetical protein n=1 Tax=uncultured Sphaerochaeta sp. TaxID=886478 RepID=UPI002618C923|nr:hypothetical protein [uncultured Sphaerochaeta sp.]